MYLQCQTSRDRCCLFQSRWCIDTTFGRWLPKRLASRKCSSTRNQNTKLRRMQIEMRRRCAIFQVQHRPSNQPNHLQHRMTFYWVISSHFFPFSGYCVKRNLRSCCMLTQMCIFVCRFYGAYQTRCPFGRQCSDLCTRSAPFVQHFR